MIDWLYLLMGILLSIVGFIFGMIFLIISTDKDSFLGAIITITIAIILILFGVYSIWVGLGLPTP